VVFFLIRVTVAVRWHDLLRERRKITGPGAIPMADDDGAVLPDVVMVIVVVFVVPVMIAGRSLIYVDVVDSVTAFRVRAAESLDPSAVIVCCLA
jgi:hypothetical protein